MYRNIRNMAIWHTWHKVTYRNCKTNLACTYNALQCICECQDTDPRKLHCWQAHCSWTVTHIWNKNGNSLQLKTETEKKTKKCKKLCIFTTWPTLHSFKTGWNKWKQNQQVYLAFLWVCGRNAYSNVYLTAQHMWCLSPMMNNSEYKPNPVTIIIIFIITKNNLSMVVSLHVHN